MTKKRVRRAVKKEVSDNDMAIYLWGCTIASFIVAAIWGKDLGADTWYKYLGLALLIEIPMIKAGWLIGLLVWGALNGFYKYMLMPLINLAKGK